MQVKGSFTTTLPFFFYQGFPSQILTTHRIAGEGRGPSFIPLYHFHLLMNIQTFICNFAYEMTTTYFKLHRLHLPDCYSKRFTVLLDTIWLIAVMLVFVCLRNDLILAFLIQKSEKGNRWTQTRINYHPCITSEMTNQVC